jgi:hypothetical protein
MSILMMFVLWTGGILGFSALLVWLVLRRVRSREKMQGDMRGLRRSIIRSGVVLSLPLMIGIVEVIRGEQPKALLIVEAIPIGVMWLALRTIKRRSGAFGPSD